MRNFLLKLSYLLVPLILLSYPLDLLFSSTLKKSHECLGEYEVWNDIYDSNINCEIAIYGSSRAWVQIDPFIIEENLGKKAYNFGIDGHNFNLQYMRHLEYIKHNKKPKHILLNVDVFTLEKRDDLYKLEQFLPYMLWNKNIAELTATYQGFNKSDYYIPFVRYMGKNKVFEEVKSLILNKKKDTALFRKNGYRGFKIKWKASVDSLLASNQKYKIKFHKETIIQLEEFVKDLQKDNIKLTLVYAPEFIKGQDFVVNREEAIQHFNRLAKKYNLKFLDYSRNEFSYQKELFYNASHLNKKGSKLFTTKLSLDLIKADSLLK